MPEILKFDDEFQLALLTLVLKNEEVIKKVKAIQNFPELFDDALSKTCAEISLEFYSKHSCLLKKDQLLFELEKRGFVQVQKPIQSLYSKEQPTPVNWYTEHLQDYVYHTHFKEHLEKAVTNFELGKLDSATQHVKGISKLSRVDNTIGFNFFKSLNHEYTEEMSKIPTGIKPLDISLGGGLAAGEVGLIMAPSGVGKSMALCYLGSQFIQRKYKTQHYTFELSEEKTRMRYEAALSHIPINELRGRFDEKIRALQELQKELSIGDNLYIKHFPTKSCTIDMLSAHMDMLADIDYEPEVLLVDYLDILKWSSHLEKIDGLAENAESLRRLAGERHVPLWSATQTNRDAINKIIYGMENIGGAYEKAQIVDVIICICQTEDEKRANIWRLFVAKNRGNASGQEIECEIDLSTVDLNLRSDFVGD